MDIFICLMINCPTEEGKRTVVIASQKALLSVDKSRPMFQYLWMCATVLSTKPGKLEVLRAPLPLLTNCLE